MKLTSFAFPTLALLCFATGCPKSGNTKAANCPSGTVRANVTADDYTGIPYAEDGVVCLSQKPLPGVPFLGTYQYDNFGTLGEPEVVLSTSGGSTFQSHGVTPRPIEWGILVDSDNVPVGRQSEFGISLYLFFKYTGSGHLSCTPGTICDEQNQMEISSQTGEWQAASLTVDFDRQQVRIYGERIRPCNGACQMLDPAPYWPEN